jgi:hypothetical protein
LGKKPSGTDSPSAKKTPGKICVVLPDEENGKLVLTPDDAEKALLFMRMKTRVWGRKSRGRNGCKLPIGCLWLMLKNCGIVYRAYCPEE